jgi:phage replication initiation protein
MMGSPQSDSLIRAYDKGMQQHCCKAGEWVRMELQLRDDNARSAFTALVEAKSWEALVGVIANAVEFKVEAVDVNKHRVARAAWWDQFLEGCKRVPLAVKKVGLTVDKLMACLSKQWGPNIRALMLAEGGSIDWLMGIVEDATDRMRSKHFNLVLAAT